MMDHGHDNEGVNEAQEEKREVKSTLVSRNITVLGRRTSVRLEPEMWSSLREIAKREQCKIHDICSLIQLRKNPDTSLTAAIRVFIMLYYRASSTENGHAKAGHGDFGNMMSRARMTDEMLVSLKKAKRVMRHGNSFSASTQINSSQGAVASY